MVDKKAINEEIIEEDSISDESMVQTQIKEIIERNPKKKLKFIGLLDFKNLSNKPPPVSFRISRKSKDYQRFKNAVYGKSKGLNKRV